LLHPDNREILDNLGLTKRKTGATLNQHLPYKTGSTMLLGFLVFLVPEHIEHYLR
jgi:hypothetical protein